MRLFAEMGRVGQVIYFTHHQHLAEIAKTVCPEARVHELRVAPLSPAGEGWGEVGADPSSGRLRRPPSPAGERGASALHALDVPVHHQGVAVLDPLALGDALLAGLV